MTRDRSIDVARARAETPGCAQGVFLASAGSSLPTSRTLNAVIGHLQREAQVGGYAAADEATDQLAQGRRDLATLIGAQADEIALTTSDSTAFAKAWWGWVAGGNIRPGATVLVDRLSYHSHHAAITQTRRLTDFEIDILPTHHDGTIDVDNARIDRDVAAVCATMIGTHSGNVNPIADIGELTRAVGVPYFVDACQALGHLELDVKALECDVLTATGRKYLRGPRGTGMLWVAPSIIERFQPPGIDGTSTHWDTNTGFRVHAGIERFEEYERSYAAFAGLASAGRQAVEIGVANIEAHIVSLAEQLRTMLGTIPGVSIHDTAARRCGIVTFTADHCTTGAIIHAARSNGITLDESNAVWSALDMNAKGLPRVVRASPHYFNTTDDLEHLTTLIARTAGTR